MLFRPNPTLGVPTYLQLAEQVRDALAAGAFRPGEPLPPVRRLAAELVMNPNAVARAYRELEDEGLITRDLVSGHRASTALSDDRPLAAGRNRSPRELDLENRRLTAQLAAEADDRLKRNRELARAEEVQRRLFPQTCPDMPGLDYAGTCRAALGVGGDYYDFFRLSDHELGIAIGDVSGKGLPAALLMATLRAYVHAQTPRRVDNLPALMVKLNRLVYESSAPDRYATFFYGQYESTTRLFTYVNAGHNAPMLLTTRDDVPRLLRLDVGGPVIGLFADCAYNAGRVTLTEGDVLLLFSDGVTEAIDAGEAEWGEERLLEALAAARAMPAHDLVERILRASDAFVGGAPQHDDQTLIAVRVLPREEMDRRS